VQDLAQRSAGGMSATARIASSIASAVILTFFAMQIYYAPHTSLPYKIGIIAVIALIGFGGIHALLTPEPDDPLPAERLYTSDEVAALLAAVQSGRLVAATPDTCKFCSGTQPDVTGVDGSHYHQHCFQAAYQKGKT
jgi:hypothetical protein